MHLLFGGKAHYLGTLLQWINLEIKCGCSNLYKGWAQEREQENNQQQNGRAHIMAIDSALKDLKDKARDILSKKKIYSCSC